MPIIEQQQQQQPSVCLFHLIWIKNGASMEGLMDERAALEGINILPELCHMTHIIRSLIIGAGVSMIYMRLMWYASYGIGLIRYQPHTLSAGYQHRKNGLIELSAITI